MIAILYGIKIAVNEKAGIRHPDNME